MEESTQLRQEEGFSPETPPVQPESAAVPGPVSEEDRRIRREVAEFERSFPQVYDQMKEDLSRLPDEVWDMVRQGASLTAAYARHTVAQSAAPSRSTGSMRSAGNDTIRSDPFLKGFLGGK